MMPLNKPCFIPYCPARISRRLLMCRDHWRLVPEHLQQRVYVAVRAIDSDLEAYLLATYNAALAVVEGESDRTDLVIGVERWLREEIARLERTGQ